MGEFTPLMARDGHEFQAYLAAPRGAKRGAVVVLQEIFGVNAHIRALADGYADQGYVAIAPCLFDRVAAGLELGYTSADIERGRGTMLQITREQSLKDIAACLAVVRNAGRAAIVGYCWGGLLAYLAAGELRVSCGVSYYGGNIAQHLERLPKRPMLYHFGERDAHIPLEDVERIRAADTSATIHLYPAGHGFNCPERADFHAESAALALQRTLAFLGEHVG